MTSVQIIHGIKRSDGLWYQGTADRDAIWGDRETAAKFRSKFDAERRRDGLEKAESGSATFTIEITGQRARAGF